MGVRQQRTGGIRRAFPIFRTAHGKTPAASLPAHPEITAIVCPHDGCAIHCWRWPQAEGVRVPEDYSLAGFDDTESVLDAAGHALLTSVRQPLREMGRAAGELALRHIRAASTGERHRLLPAALTVRRSTAPPGRRYRPPRRRPARARRAS